MLTKVEDHKESSSKRTWGDFKGKRSEAMPAASLFGSSLEMQNDKQREAMKNIDVKSVRFQSQGSKRIQPGENFFLPGSKEFLNQQKQELAELHAEALKAKEAKEATEEQRKNFSENIDQAELSKKPDSQRSGKFTRSDLENALLMNRVGYNEGRSYNREKYQPKPPQHQYSLIGNVLRTGADFALNPEDYKRYPEEAYMTQPMSRKKPLPGISTSNDKPHLSTDVLSAADLPPNIRHQFGTTLCNSIFADPNLVQESMKDTKKTARQTKKSSLKPLEPKDIQDQKMDPNYQTIGLTMRQNIFPGYSYGHKISHMKDVHSPNIYERRQPDPDQWRYQRDELAIWNEYDTINKRLKKKWEEYEENAPKLQPNWDRNAKRPPKPPEALPPKPRLKMQKKDNQKKPSELIEDDLIFEDIEFKTPPLSPPPQALPQDLIPAFTKDDDFWDFYNQALP